MTWSIKIRELFLPTYWIHVIRHTRQARQGGITSRGTLRLSQLVEHGHSVACWCRCHCRRWTRSFCCSYFQVGGACWGRSLLSILISLTISHSNLISVYPFFSANHRTTTARHCWPKLREGEMALIPSSCFVCVILKCQTQPMLYRCNIYIYIYIHMHEYMYICIYQDI